MNKKKKKIDQHECQTDVNTQKDPTLFSVNKQKCNFQHLISYEQAPVNFFFFL